MYFLLLLATTCNMVDDDVYDSAEVHVFGQVRAPHQSKALHQSDELSLHRHSTLKYREGSRPGRPGMSAQSKCHRVSRGLMKPWKAFKPKNFHKISGEGAGSQLGCNIILNQYLESLSKGRPPRYDITGWKPERKCMSITVHHEQ
jgi:hypothetical protein